MNNQLSHEEALVKAFIDPRRQERYLEFVSKPKKRINFSASSAISNI